MSLRGVWRRGDRVTHLGHPAMVSSVYDAGVILAYDDGRARMIPAKDAHQLIRERESNPNDTVYFRGEAYQVMRDMGTSLVLFRGGRLTYAPKAEVTDAAVRPPPGRPTQAGRPEPSVKSPTAPSPRPEKSSARRPAEPARKTVTYQGVVYPVLHQTETSVLLFKGGHIVSVPVREVSPVGREVPPPPRERRGDTPSPPPPIPDRPRGAAREAISRHSRAKKAGASGDKPHLPYHCLITPERRKYAEGVPAEAKAIAKQIKGLARQTEWDRLHAEIANAEAKIERLRAAAMRAGEAAAKTVGKDKIKEGLASTRPGGTVLGKAVAEAVRKTPEFQRFVSFTDKPDQYAYDLRDEVFDRLRGKTPENRIEGRFHRPPAKGDKPGTNLSFADKHAKDKISRESADQISARIGQEFMDYLPPGVHVDLDARGTVTRLTDLFDNLDETFWKKVLRQHNLMYRYPLIMQQLWADAESGSENCALPATVLLLIEHTGIRPGRETSITEAGGKTLFEIDPSDPAKKKRKIGPDGKPVVAGKEKIYGAVTLLTDHVKFSKDKANLRFVGKAGTVNEATVTDPRLVQLLKKYAGKGQERLFTFSDGRPFSENNLQWYLDATRANPIFDEVRATDFRKLRGTREFYDDLKELSPDMYSKIKQLPAARRTRDAVAKIVQGTLDRAVSRAQTALNHEDSGTTIGSYINPEIVLYFLSEGGVDRTLEKTILGKRLSLKFDHEAFVRNALQPTGKP